MQLYVETNTCIYLKVEPEVYLYYKINLINKLKYIKCNSVDLFSSQKTGSNRHWPSAIIFALNRINLLIDLQTLCKWAQSIEIIYKHDYSYIDQINGN